MDSVTFAGNQAPAANICFRWRYVSTKLAYGNPTVFFYSTCYQLLILLLLKWYYDQIFTP